MARRELADCGEEEETCVRLTDNAAVLLPCCPWPRCFFIAAPLNVNPQTPPWMGNSHKSWDRVEWALQGTCGSLLL